MEIIWKDLLGYQGLYQVSNMGDVKSLSKIIKTKGNGLRNTKERILKPGITKYGYKQVTLSKNGITKSYTIHRLVAYNFCDNLHDKPIINHKDGIKINNIYTNLEWCTYSENLQHAYDNCLYIPSRNRLGFSGKKHKDSMPVIQFTLNNEYISEYESIGLTRQAGFTPQHVHSCCIGKLKTHAKFKWKFKHES